MRANWVPRGRIFDNINLHFGAVTGGRRVDNTPYRSNRLALFAHYFSNITGFYPNLQRGSPRMQNLLDAHRFGRIHQVFKNVLKEGLHVFEPMFKLLTRPSSLPKEDFRLG